MRRCPPEFADTHAATRLRLPSGARRLSGSGSLTATVIVVPMVSTLDRLSLRTAWISGSGDLRRSVRCSRPRRGHTSGPLPAGGGCSTGPSDCPGAAPAGSHAPSWPPAGPDSPWARPGTAHAGRGSVPGPGQHLWLTVDGSDLVQDGQESSATVEAFSATGITIAPSWATTKRSGPSYPRAPHFDGDRRGPTWDRNRLPVAPFRARSGGIFRFGAPAATPRGFHGAALPDTRY